MDLFFVLSGFLITSILYDAKRSDGYFRNFYMRRVLRIFPLYYGVLFVAFLIVPPAAAPPKRGHYQNIAAPPGLALGVPDQNSTVIRSTGRWFTHFWSLAVEEQFYLVWPAVVFLLNRRALMGVCGALMVAALGIRLGAR